MFGRKKKQVKTEEKPLTPKAVMAGSEEGSNVLVGDQNDPNRIVVMKQTYNGTPDKDFRFAVDESMVSKVYIEDVGYLDDTVEGSVQPSKYWDKKFIGKKAKDVSVLSFSDKPFTLVTGFTTRVPGGDLDGTVRGSFKFKKEDPRSIASLLVSTYAQEKDNLDVHYKYINAENFEMMLRTAFQDVIRMPMFVEKIYEDIDDIQDAILQKVKDTPFFIERSLDVSEISVRFDRTEVEKLEDSEVKHRILMRMAEMEKEQRQEAIELAKEESETFKEI